MTARVWIVTFAVLAFLPVSASAQEQVDKDANELLEEVGKRVPEFAGIWAGSDQDSYNVSVTSTRPGLLEDLRDALVDVLGDLRHSTFEKITLVEGATYSWLQLIDWYRPLTANVHQLEGVTSSSIGHKENRIQIGVVDPERHSAAVEEEIDRLDIPRDAVIIHQQGPFAYTSDAETSDAAPSSWSAKALGAAAATAVFLVAAALIWRKRRHASA